MNILNKLTLTNLKLNKKRTIVTIIGIILSGAMICGVAAIAESFQDLILQSVYETDGNYHATFYNVRYDKSKYISENPYSKETMFTKNLGYAKFEESKNEDKPYFFIREYDQAAFINMPVTLKEGRFPDRDGEIVISEDVLLDGGIKHEIGQILTLNIGNRIDDGVQLIESPLSKTETFEPVAARSYTITGIISKERFGAFKGPGFTVIAYLDKNKLTPEETSNVSIITRNPRQIYKKVPQIAENAGVEKFGYNNEILKWMGISKNQSYLNMIWSIVLIIIILIVVGSVTVIYNAFAISVSERKKQFGMLASVGATPKQIRRTVFFEGIVLGAIGIPIGILSGIFGIGVTLKIVNNLVRGSMFSENISLRLVVSPWVIIVTLFFVGLVIFISAYIPARIASRISPIQAIRLNTDIKIKGKKLRTSKLTRLIFGIEGELALKNLKRNRRRYRATVFSIFISIVLFISFSAFMAYGFQSSAMYYGYNHFDVAVQKPVETEQEFFEEIAQLEGVERYSIIRRIYSASYLENSKIGTFYRKNYIDSQKLSNNEVGLPMVYFSLTTLGRKEFDAFVKENGLDSNDYKDKNNIKAILINKNIYEGAKLHEYEPLRIKKGEKLQLTENQREEERVPVSYEVEIGAVTKEIPFGFFFNGMNVNLIVSDEVYDDIRLKLHEQSQHQEINMNIKAEDSAGVAKKIRELNNKYKGSLTVSDISSMAKEMKRTKTVISIFLYGFLSLITLIGVTNIFNTISTNVALRRREFAMLKSVGLTPKGFNKMINYESIFYGLKALLYGLPVGIFVSSLMYNSFSNLFKFSFILPWKEILFCIASVFGIVFITMMHSSSKLRKENIIDALKQENI